MNTTMTKLSTASNMSLLEAAKNTKARKRSCEAAPRMPKRTHVHFAEEIEFFVHPRAASSSGVKGSEKSDRWYTPEEFRAISQSIDLKMRDRKRKVSAIRRNFSSCILDLQDEQQSMGITDPNGLACQARACCRLSRREAIARAADVAMEVLAYRQREMASQTTSIIEAVLDIVSDDEFDLSVENYAASPPQSPRERPAMLELQPPIAMFPLPNRF